MVILIILKNANIFVMYLKSYLLWHQRKTFKIYVNLKRNFQRYIIFKNFPLISGECL